MGEKTASFLLDGLCRPRLAALATTVMDVVDVFDMGSAITATKGTHLFDVLCFSDFAVYFLALFGVAVGANAARPCVPVEKGEKGNEDAHEGEEYPIHVRCLLKGGRTAEVNGEDNKPLGGAVGEPDNVPHEFELFVVEEVNGNE